MVTGIWVLPDRAIDSSEGIMNIQGGWIASLSDGSTVIETPPVEGEPSAWQKLLERCRTEWVHVVDDEGRTVVLPLRITMLRLQYGRITIMALPNDKCDGYFQAREVHRIMYRDAYLKLHGIGSVVDDRVEITWLEITADGQFYIRNDVRPLDTCKVHTTMN
jgi:hypothetical protein